MMPAKVISEKTPDLGCSARAISVARILDRLEPGDYIIRLSKAGNNESHYWSVEISRQEKIDSRVIGKGA